MAESVGFGWIKLSVGAVAIVGMSMKWGTDCVEQIALNRVVQTGYSWRRSAWRSEAEMMKSPASARSHLAIKRSHPFL